MKMKAGDAIMAKVYMHVIDRQTEKLWSLIGDEEMDKFIEEVSKEVIDIFCAEVVADDFRDFFLSNLDGILTGNIDYSDFKAQETEPSGIGS